MGCRPSIDQGQSQTSKACTQMEMKHRNSYEHREVVKPQLITRRRYTDKRPKELKNIRKIDNKARHKKTAKMTTVFQASQLENDMK